jgi:hypothetical protein
MQTAVSLIASFPPEFIFGRDEFNRAWAFEHLVILDVVLNTIVELNYLDYLSDLKSIFSTASAAVQCALLERSGGGFIRKDFGVSQFKPVFDSFMNYFQEVILQDAVLLARWEQYQALVFIALRKLCPKSRK